MALRYNAVIRLLSSLRYLVFRSSITTASAEAERSPRVRTRNFPLHRRLYAFPQTDIGLRCYRPARPRAIRLVDASLSFDARFHLRLPSDPPSRARQRYASAKDLVLQIDAPALPVLGSLRQGPMRTFTSNSAPMPGAPDTPCATLRLRTRAADAQIVRGAIKRGRGTRQEVPCRPCS